MMMDMDYLAHSVELLAGLNHIQYIRVRVANASSQEFCVKKGV